MFSREVAGLMRAPSAAYPHRWTFLGTAMEEEASCSSSLLR